ncbi:DNA adenine methylase [Pseudomonas brassicacearum]|uniref:site-specific DNA-methyltransferase (adenine-specific) n=1 Tax=Pseudomonas brassicacearum TaxID=930166 RepID=A0A423J7K8_9PSED|nr:DNA adenine methylase [Pseudomonas brassicacearum]RON33693.1 DNA methyltransferase [Pseudomonas brassicacearum]
MYSNKLYSPLRYPGGKARFAPFIAEVMRANGLESGHYLEPFAGGAGVALELLFDGHATHVHINDLDPAVFVFWSAVTADPDGVLKLLHDTPITMDQWYHWRSVMLGQDPDLSLAERGFATLFVNRTNRSGILKGGVIGGKSQAGTYKLDARFSKEMIAARLERIALNADRISVYCEDAFLLLSRAAEFLPEQSLIYLDPPYYVKGRGLYRNFYKHDDHLQIAQLLQSPDFERPWVVSYDSAPEICEMYSQNEALSYGLHYTAQARYVGDEVMFFKEGISVPDAKIPRATVAA